MPGPSRTAFHVLFGLSLCHLLNDMMQALLPAIYPMLKSDFELGFWQLSPELVFEIWCGVHHAEQYRVG